MPANLTPDYIAAEARFRAAETNEDKLAALEEMYATIPKHKGTEKLQADIKKRISKLREKEKQSKKTGKKIDAFHIVREGAGQVALIGPPNAGKSSLLKSLTSANPQVTDYPGATRIPLPGMMEYENIQIQILDTPPLLTGQFDKAVLSLARSADAIAIVLDASEDSIAEQFEEILADMSNSKLTISGREDNIIEQQAGTVTRPGLVIVNKTDAPNGADNLLRLMEYYSADFDIIGVSVRDYEGLEELREAFFRVLRIVRIYTKQPGKPADMDKPFILKKGSTLSDFALLVHKDFAEKLKMAKAWGEGLRDGVQIGRGHVLADGTVVELYR